MARTFHVYLEPARVPARADWQAVIKKLGFSLMLDDAYAAFETRGYLPCTLEGEDAGVDLRFESDVPGHGARTALLKLRWGGDVREQLSALILAGSLADGFDALVIEPDAGAEQAAAELLKRAKKLRGENF